MSDLLHLAAFLIPCIFVQRLVIDFISFLDLLNFDRDSLRFWLLNNFDGIKFIKLSFVFGDELSYNFLNIGSLSVKKQSLHFLNIFLQLFDSFSHYLYYRGFENLYQYQKLIPLFYESLPNFFHNCSSKKKHPNYYPHFLHFT